MISHKHKCIYVHVPKVAGISIEQLFLDDLKMDFNNRGALLLGVNPNKNIGPPRISNLVAKEYVGLHYISQELFDEYFKFSFVRNPYDRIFSFYKYLSYDRLTSFENFVVKYLPKAFEDSSIYYFIQPMYNYIYSDEGTNMVDFVGKLENIKNDVKIIADRLKLVDYNLQNKNVSESMGFKTKVKRSARLINKQPEIVLDYLNKDAVKNYNGRMKNSMAKLYQKDFEYFGYEW